MADVQHKTTPITPHLTVSNAAKAMDFYEEAFGAKELRRMLADDKKRIMHASMEMNGGGVIMLNDDFPEYMGGRSRTPEAIGGTPATLHLQQKRAKDVDALFKRATDAGATSEMEPADMFWGDRYGIVVDPFGHRWSIGAPTKS